MIAFDTETTGLLLPSATDLHLQPYIIEIYAIKFDADFKPYGEFYSRVKPPVPIPPKITQITGLADADVKHSPSFVQIYDDLSDFFRGEKTVFAHNCSFDIGMLRNELQRYGWEYKFPWPSNHVCTVEASHPIKNRRMRLSELHELATGLPEIQNAHRAKDDVLALVKCIMWLAKNGFVELTE